MKEIIFAMLLLAAGMLDLYVLPRLAAAEADGRAVVTQQALAQSLYDLRTRSLEGEPVALDAWRGQVALVVNVASRCGLTPQYAGLEKLYRELASRGFVVLGFPSNDFLNQEPGNAVEIRNFCEMNYGVTFPLFEKVRVKGDRKSEVYRFLTGEYEEPNWNFTKYLVDRDGGVLARFGPRTPPDDPRLRQAIEKALSDRPAAEG
jgi:glutathione peroxidase